MIMLGFIILGHPQWRKSQIRIFEVCKQEELEKTKNNIEELLQSGRLPITLKNVEMIIKDNQTNIKKIVCEKSAKAGLTFIGFHSDSIKHIGGDLFKGYESILTTMFVNSVSQKYIE